MASDVMSSEGGEGTREEKDKSTGSAVGRGVGSIGGMAAGAAAGAALGSIVPGLGTAIGGIIGGVVGGFMGDKAGDIIGETVGGWVSDLRSSNIGGAITEKWAYTTEFMGSLWSQSTAGISDRWAAVSDTVSSMWTTVSDSANAAWGAVSAGATALWDGVSSSLTSTWSTAVDKMQAGWSSAVDLASKGWEALSGLAGSAKDWLKEKTGVDLDKVYETVSTRASEIVGGAGEVVTSAWDKAVDIAASAKDAVKAGAGKVADATGMTNVVNAVKTAGKAADNKVSGLRAGNNWAGARDDIVEASEAAGVDPGVLAKIAKYESNFDSGATPTRKDGTKISSAHGYGQFLDGTWTDSINKHGAKYGVEGAGKLNTEQAAKYRNDPKIQAAMLAEFTKENIDQGRKYGGRDDDANVYAFHNLGGGDAKKMLSGMNAGMDVRQSLMQGVNTDKGRARVEQVIAGNKDLYGDGSRSAKDAYKVMGDRMRAGESYAEDARSHLLAKNQAASAPAEMVASTALPSPTVASPALSSPTVAASSMAPAAIAVVPSAPSISIAPAPAIAAVAEAPEIERISMGGGRRQATASAAPTQIPRDLEDRRIAHIVTGAYSGAV